MAQDSEQYARPKTIRELLGMEPEVFAVPPDAVIPDLPVAQTPSPPQAQQPAEAVKPEPTKSLLEGLQPPPPPKREVKPAVAQKVEYPEEEEFPEPIEVGEFGSPLSRFFAKDWVRYPVIFLVALGFFFVILNFHSVGQQLGGFIFPSGSNQKTTTANVPADYTKWIQKYYVYENDQTLLAPSADPDQDGLTNIEEYYLGTNPLRSDTDGDGFLDGQEVVDGYNPLYPGKLTDAQRKLVDAYVDKTDVQSRLRFSGFTGVAGATIREEDVQFPIDTTKPGHISIPKIGVDAQVAWTKDFNLMENDLKNGTAHHPDTPYPGQLGTVSIHGHSSGNPGDGNFKTVFTKLNFLSAGDEVYVTVYDRNGNSRQYRYVVRYAKVYSKTDPAQFADLGGYYLNLSTSWPIGTALQRYVVTTQMVGFN